MIIGIAVAIALTWWSALALVIVCWRFQVLQRLKAWSATIPRARGKSQRMIAAFVMQLYFIIFGVITVTLMGDLVGCFTADPSFGGTEWALFAAIFPIWVFTIAAASTGCLLSPSIGRRMAAGWDTHGAEIRQDMRDNEINEDGQ